MLNVAVFGALLGLWLPLPAPQTSCKIARHPPLTLLYARGADSGDPVDEDRVYALIEEREGLRKSRDYAAADDVRDELSRMGVTLWDRDRVWMCGTGAPPSRQAPDAPRFSPDGPARRGDRKFTGAFRGAERGQGYRKGPAEFRERFAETKIFVENLSFETDWMALKDHFIDAGYPTVYASVSYDKERGRSKGCGIVQFETVDAMNAAVEQMTGSMLDGRSINCRPDAKGNQRGGRTWQLFKAESRSSGRARRCTTYATVPRPTTERMVRSRSGPAPASSDSSHSSIPCECTAGRSSPMTSRPARRITSQPGWRRMAPRSACRSVAPHSA